MVRQNAQIWDFIAPTGPSPGWLPDLAEAVAGRRADDDGGIHEVSRKELMQMREKLNSFAPEKTMTRWLTWFLADRETRLISPFAAQSTSEYLQQRIEDDSRESLTHALRIAPLNSLVQARLGRKLMMAFPTSVTQRDRAEWLTRLASQQTPRDASVWTLRADVLEMLDRLDEAEAALARAFEIRTEDPHAWEVRAFLLQRKGDSELAYQAFLKTLQSVRRNTADSANADATYLHERLREIAALEIPDATAYLALVQKDRDVSRDQLRAEWFRRRAGELAPKTSE
jgi:tetratricopeptide (TPR) repeat protein